MQTDVKQMKKLVTAALCLALCLVLPFLTANNMALGNMLSLMHIPVLLCGLVCSWHYGLLVGFMAPLLRSFLLGAPPLMIAVPMAFELAVYGLVAGLLYPLFRGKKAGIYMALIPALICGRVSAAVVKFAMLGLGYLQAFTLSQFVQSYLVIQWPAILLQLTLIPLVVFALQKAKLVE